jgi:hypothetical protein
VSQPGKRKLISEERTEIEIKHRTHFAKAFAARAEKAIDEWKRDARRTDRLAACECKTCFYLRSTRVGGTAVTTAPCRLCGELMQFATTVVTEICEKCSRENDACRMCMADVELRLQ